MYCDVFGFGSVEYMVDVGEMLDGLVVVGSLFKFYLFFMEVKKSVS